MRKKELLNQNIVLFEQLEKCRIALKNATDELDSVKGEISKLELENKILKSRIDHLSETAAKETGFVVNTEEEAVKSIQSKPENEIAIPDFVMSDDFQYGSEVIGNIIVETANSVNKLTDCDEETKHTLSNLIVCRSELAKSEILSIVNSESAIETKKEMIDSVLSETVDYYKSVIAQII